MPQSAVLVTESCQQAAILAKVNPQLHKHYVDGFMSDVIHSLINIHCFSVMFLICSHYLCCDKGTPLLRIIPPRAIIKLFSGEQFSPPNPSGQ